MSRKLIMLRHGQTDFNASTRMQGHLDTTLSDVGRQQAHSVARYFAGVKINHIVSSDLSRAAETARIVASTSDIPVVLDQRLRETNLGDWQGRTRSEVDAKYPGARAQWRHDALWAPPGGEARVEVAKRARAVIDQLMHSHDMWDDNTVLLVAHGGTIGALTSDLLGLSVAQHHMFSGLGNACWATLKARPRYSEMTSAVSPRFNHNTVQNAQWYLDGWNMSVLPGQKAG